MLKEESEVIMNKKEHLPILGVGPIYVLVIITCTIVGIVLSATGLLPYRKIDALKIPFMILGVILIIIGIYFWVSANFQSKLDSNIRSNTLIITGVYAYVRNPIYSAFMLGCTGVILIADNILLLVLPVFYWLFMTVLMKNTEEKWLRDLYGEEYLEYCKRVNRCIPWFRKLGNKKENSV